MQLADLNRRLADLGARLGQDEVWVAGLLYGQATADPEQAERLLDALQIVLTAAGAAAASGVLAAIILRVARRAPLIVHVVVIVVAAVLASKGHSVEFVTTLGGMAADVLKSDTALNQAAGRVDRVGVLVHETLGAGSPRLMVEVVEG